MKLREKAREISGNFTTRLVAGLLIASLPITIVLGVLLTQTASTSLNRTTRQGGESIARSVALRMEDWVSERKESIDVIAARASGALDAPATNALLTKVEKTYGDFTVIEVTDLAGNVVSSEGTGATFGVGNAEWFHTIV